MISVAEALQRVLALARPMGDELVPLRHAAGRRLAQDVTATRDQPPFPSSAMDGYAVRAEDVAPSAELSVIGEAAAGHAFDGVIGAVEAVRIFTGAPVPSGASRVIIQEDVTRSGDKVVLNDNVDSSFYIRSKGDDFKVGDTVSAPRRLVASDIALIASMNFREVSVKRRPEIAIIATGDELVMPGENPRNDQIIASNTFGLAALFEAEGAFVRILPIARDTAELLKTAFSLATDSDLIVTIGGASVGDHDIVGQLASELGMDRSFYKVAMRPGKPLMAGHLNGLPLIGLPGNPVSSMICGHIFILPMIRAMMGDQPGPLPRYKVPLAAALNANGPREHYMRAIVENGRVHAADRQDSALLSVLATANALIVRPPDDPPRAEGVLVDVIDL